MSRSDWIAGGALLISAITWYWGPRKYDDAVMFFNSPQIVQKELIAEDKDRPILSEIKKFSGDIKFSFGVMNNGTTPLVLKILDVKEYRRDVYARSSGDLISKFDNYPGEFCKYWQYTEDEKRRYSKPFIIKPGEIVNDIEFTEGVLVENLAPVLDNRGYLYCVTLSVIKSDGSEYINRDFWSLITYHRANDGYSREVNIAYSGTWPKNGIPLVGKRFSSKLYEVFGGVVEE